MKDVVLRGAAAGAAGVSAVNLVTYLDMVLSGRSESELPAQATGAALERLGVHVPGDREQRDNRHGALGALAGMSNGVAIGVLASLARRYGIRLPAPVTAIALGAVAMAAADVPAAASGATRPQDWDVQDWARDVVPHLVFGVVTRWVVDGWGSNQAERRVLSSPAASVGLLARSLALGVAAGGRSTLGLFAPAVLGGPAGPVVRTLAAGLVGAELTADKLPATPNRLAPAGIVPRFASGAVGATLIARRESATPTGPVLAAVLGTALGALAGTSWRASAERRGWTWQAALVEDAVATCLAVLACRRGTAPTSGDAGDRP